MKREFNEVPLFSRKWSSIGMNEADLIRLQLMLVKDPRAGLIIEGTGGIRKMRFAYTGRGKSGSVCVCYVDFEEYGIIYLITAYSKNDKETLSEEERNILKSLVKKLKNECAGNRGGKNDII